MHDWLISAQTFGPKDDFLYSCKLDLLTAYLGKLKFLSVTVFSLGNLPKGNFIVLGAWIIMSPEQYRVSLHNYRTPKR